MDNPDCSCKLPRVGEGFVPAGLSAASNHVADNPRVGRRPSVVTAARLRSPGQSSSGQSLTGRCAGMQAAIAAEAGAEAAAAEAGPGGAASGPPRHGRR